MRGALGASRRSNGRRDCARGTTLVSEWLQDLRCDPAEKRFHDVQTSPQL
jgi:hypothetical protein